MISHLRDEEVAGAVQAALARDGRIGSANRIKVTVYQGDVMLAGVVDAYAEKAAAGEDAAAVPGVRRVENGIAVSTDGATDDAELAAAVDEALARAKGFALREVGAELADGTVTLVGHVRDLAEEQAAIEAARSVKGVKNVVSALVLANESAVTDTVVDDATTKNMIVDALSAAGLDYLADGVSVDDGVATLRGTVSATDERKRALAAVRGVTGVHSVKDALVLAGAPTSADEDQRLLAHVIQALREVGADNPLQIKVRVRQGVVHLTGQADSIDLQNAAVQAARGVPGVRQVIDQITLMDRTSEPSDDKGRPKANIQGWLQERR